MPRSANLGTMAVSIGFFTLGGLLVSQVGALGGIALGSFNILLLGPIVTIGLRAKGCLNIGNKNVATAIGVVTVVGSIFLSLYCAQLICNTFDTLPSFTYIDALKVFGHSLWMGLALIILKNSVKKPEDVPRANFA